MSSAGAQPRTALFVDRDGVLNRRVVGGYVTVVEDLEPLDEALPALHVGQDAGAAIVIVSNQGAIGRRMLSEATLQEIHARLLAHLGEHGITVDGIYVCPHHPEAVAESDRACSCRKPLPGLLVQAAADLSLDLASSVMIGDQPSDRQAAQAAGIEEGYFAIDDVDLAQSVRRRLTTA